MKKIYSKPAMAVVPLDGNGVIATSIGPNQMGFGSQTEATDGASGEAPRRRGGIWDED